MPRQTLRTPSSSFPSGHVSHSKGIARPIEPETPPFRRPFPSTSRKTTWRARAWTSQRAMAERQQLQHGAKRNTSVVADEKTRDEAKKRCLGQRRTAWTGVDRQRRYGCEGGDGRTCTSRTWTHVSTQVVHCNRTSASDAHASDSSRLHLPGVVPASPIRGPANRLVPRSTRTCLLFLPPSDLRHRSSHGRVSSKARPWRSCDVLRFRHVHLEFSEGRTEELSEGLSEDVPTCSWSSPLLRRRPRRIATARRT